MDNRKFFTLVLLVLFAAAALAAAVYFRTQKIKQPIFPEWVEAPVLSGPQETGSSGTNMIDQGSKKGISTQESEANVVHYSDIGFIPRVVTVSENSAGDGCFITVVNNSDKALEIRLNPPGKDNWGPQYQAIAPYRSMALDPRFRIESIAYHNRAQPAQEFGVKLGQGCTLE